MAIGDPMGAKPPAPPAMSRMGAKPPPMTSTGAKPPAPSGGPMGRYTGAKPPAPPMGAMGAKPPAPSGGPMGAMGTGMAPRGAPPMGAMGAKPPAPSGGPMAGRPGGMAGSMSPGGAFGMRQAPAAPVKGPMMTGRIPPMAGRRVLPGSGNR